MTIPEYDKECDCDLCKQIRRYAHKKMLTNNPHRGKAFCEVVDFIDEEIKGEP